MEYKDSSNHFDERNRQPRNQQKAPHCDWLTGLSMPLAGWCDENHSSEKSDEDDKIEREQKIELSKRSEEEKLSWGGGRKKTYKIEKSLALPWIQSFTFGTRKLCQEENFLRLLRAHPPRLSSFIIHRSCLTLALQPRPIHCECRGWSVAIISSWKREKNIGNCARCSEIRQDGFRAW